MMKRNNPNCFIVTGRPRTPHDQGSVESTNKLVQGVMKSISSERCLAGLEFNWTRLLGQVTAVCNSHSGQKKYSVSNYKAVFEQKYHPTLMCSLADICKCQSISLRLRMSPDERLEKYVQENDIIDIDVAEALLVSDFDEDKECEEEFDQMNPPVELDDTAFPSSQASYDSDKEDDNNVGSHHGAVTTYAQDNNVMVVGVRPTLQDIPAMQQDILPPSIQEDVAMQLNIGSQTFQGEVSNSVSLLAPKAAPSGPDRTMTGYLWIKQNVPNEHPQTFCMSEYLTFTLQQA
jgi:hypothetical protein